MIKAMDKQRAVATEPSGAFLSLPHVYIDTLMPALLESEWRVLLVIFRQTHGWVDGDDKETRKERDWISMNQFAKKTGLHRDSVSRAVQSLLALGLIRVESASGEVLDTPVLRKKHGARLYYRLCSLTERKRL